MNDEESTSRYATCKPEEEPMKTDHLNLNQAAINAIRRIARAKALEYKEMISVVADAERLVYDAWNEGKRDLPQILQQSEDAQGWFETVFVGWFIKSLA